MAAPMIEPPTHCLTRIKMVPWSPCNINGKHHLLKFLSYGNRYLLCLCDFTRIFFEDFGDDSLTDRCEALNPDTFEMTSGRLLKEIQKIINETFLAEARKAARTYLQWEADRLILKVVSHLVQLPFHWHFILTPGTTTDFLEHMTGPLVAMTVELCSRQDELIKLIKRKDAEIDDYKTAGGKVPKYLETKPFVEDEFLRHSGTAKDTELDFQNVIGVVFGNKGQNMYKQVVDRLAGDNYAAMIGEANHCRPKEHTSDVHSSTVDRNTTQETNVEKEATQQEQEMTRRAQLDQQLEKDRVKRKKKKVKL